MIGCLYDWSDGYKVGEPEGRKDGADDGCPVGAGVRNDGCFGVRESLGWMEGVEDKGMPEGVVGITEIDLCIKDGWLVG